MFSGDFTRPLDAKGRVILPAEHREQLGDEGFITKAPGGCLAIYTPEEYEEVAGSVREYSRQGRQQSHVARVFSAGTRPIAPDRQGRVAIAPHLREYADLDGEVKIIGNTNRIEIWNADRWAEIERESDAVLRAFDPSLDGLGL